MTPEVRNRLTQMAKRLRKELDFIEKKLLAKPIFEARSGKEKPEEGKALD